MCIPPSASWEYRRAVAGYNVSLMNKDVGTDFACPKQATDKNKLRMATARVFIRFLEATEHPFKVARKCGPLFD
jgi:hypothetical protein